MKVTELTNTAISPHLWRKGFGFPGLLPFWHHGVNPEPVPDRQLLLVIAARFRCRLPAFAASS
jgi:hypothetical protein